MPRKLLVLVIADGLGLNPSGDFNAVSRSGIPNITRLGREYPSTSLISYGWDVGLPKGVMGNSEVGHLNIGAGRIVWQDITRIDRAIELGEFASNPVIKGALERARSGGAVHLTGLVSDGCVHSAERHYIALLQAASDMKLPADKVLFHAYMDGRDTPPKSGAQYMENLTSAMKRIGVGRVATVNGRYYGMDRDKRWDRVKFSYDAMTLGEGVIERDPVEAIRNAYERGETDEFIKPVVITDASGRPVGTVKDGDSVFCFNFRADRMREIARAFMSPDFADFPRKCRPNVSYATMTQYDETFPFPIAFAQMHLNRILAEILSESGVRQLRIAETEKYAHVTYFFNGGVEKSFEGEERMLVPSPKVATYDLQPEMNAALVKDKVVEAVRSGRFDVIIVNFANCDMVGHTGMLDAAAKAVDTVDSCVGDIAAEVLARKGAMMLTSDHGNAEQMRDYGTGEPHTAHTTYPVPFIIVDDSLKGARLNEGKLCDIAPTMLEILGIAKPSEMDGCSLISK